MELTNQSGPLFAASKISFLPMNIGFSTQGEGIFGEIGARLLYLIQIATSLLALPIILLVGLCEAAYRTTTSETVTFISTIQDALLVLTTHFIAIIPTAFIGIVTNQKFTENCGESLVKIAAEIAKCWNCSTTEPMQESPPGGAPLPSSR